MRAVDLLEKHGLKACFYLDTDGISQRHEIGGTLWTDPYRQISSALKLLSPGRVISEPALIKNWGKFAGLVLDDLLEAGRGVMHMLVYARFNEERGEWHRLEQLFEDFASRNNIHNSTITEYLASIKGGPLE
jgi:hypothetical protein